MAQLDLLGTTLNPPPSASASVTLPRFFRNSSMHEAITHDSAPLKAEGAYKTISEVAGELDVPTHVLRFWESRFPQVKPQRMRGGRRYYRPLDVEVLKKIKTLLYSQGYTIKGAKKHVKDKTHEIHAETMAQAVAEAKAPKTPVVKPQPVPAATAPRKLPAELAGLLQELRELKKTLSAFA